MSSKKVSLKGGLVLSKDPLSVYPGAIQEGINFYEDINGGYTAVAGYERYDGSGRPSEELYYLATFDDWDTHVTDIFVGTTITVAATIQMRVLFMDLSVSDTLIAVVSQIDASTIPADLDTVPIAWDASSDLVSLVARGETDAAVDLIYLEAATDYARGLIGAVPGDDTISGHLQINDEVVVFRNDSTTPKFYYSGTSGLTEGKIGRVCEVSAYTADSILPGETFDSAKYRIVAVCEWYATNGTPDATKAWLVIAQLTATLQPATGGHTASDGATFTIDSIIQPITAFGSYIQSINKNFLADLSGTHAFFSDGANLPMAYLPTEKCVVPISHNYNADISNQFATVVTGFDDQLVFANGLGTFAISEPGLPFNFGGSWGAAAIGLGALITDMKESDGEHLIVYTTKESKKLTGSDTTDYVFKTSSTEAGAAPRSVQKLDDLYALSTRGVTQLIRTETTGGYLGGAISQLISEDLEGKSALLTCSTVFPNKEQIRWHFSNNEFLIMTKLPQAEGGDNFSFTWGEYPNRPVNSASTGVWSDGTERSFFTSDSGYLYEMEIGTTPFIHNR